MKSFLRCTAAVGLTLALIAVGETAAEARSPAGKSDSGNITTVARTNDGRPVNNTAIAKEIADYWTPERMADAVNLDLPRATDAAGSPARAPKASGPKGAVTPMLPAIAHDAGIQLYESPTVGKVFFTTPRGSASCTASTVASGKRRLVMTAGHCVHGGAGGQWYSNWQFIPGYRDGTRPYGTFTAYTLTTRTAWINSGNLDEDMGIAIMHNGGNWGMKVVDTVGGNGLRWNAGYAVWLIMLNPPQACQGWTWQGDSQHVRMWCAYGSGGAPWLHDYNDQTGLGYINSVTSHMHNPSQIDGPYFDNDIKSLYDFAESISPA